jgi:hypothetical protein
MAKCPDERQCASPCATPAAHDGATASDESPAEAEQLGASLYRHEAAVTPNRRADRSAAFVLSRTGG